MTGRRRRCGWFDAVALRRSIVHSSCSLLCVTKLDVLDGLDTIRVCVGYKIDGGIALTPPLLSEHLGFAEAVYEDLPGWKESTVGITRYDDLPANAQQLSRAIAGLGGRAHHHHLHGAGSRSNHHSPESVRLICCSLRRTSRGNQLHGIRNRSRFLTSARECRWKRSRSFLFDQPASVRLRTVLCFRRYHQSQRCDHPEAQGAVHAHVWRGDAGAVGILRGVLHHFHSRRCAGAAHRLYAIGSRRPVDHDGGLLVVHSGVLARAVRSVSAGSVRAGVRHHHRPGRREPLDLDARAGAHREQPLDVSHRRSTRSARPYFRTSDRS